MILPKAPKYIHKLTPEEAYLQGISESKYCEKFKTKKNKGRIPLLIFLEEKKDISK